MRTLLKFHSKCLLAGTLMMTGTSIAQAADLPPPPPPDDLRPSTYDWTGPYVGGFASVACLDTMYTPPGSDPELAGCTGAGGLLAGYAVQLDRIVLGIEGDFGWGGKVASNSLDDVVYDFDTMASIRGRLGYAVDSTLIYATAGIGWIDATLTETSIDESDSKWHVGWMVGGGIEHAIWNSLSFRLEYLYAQYGERIYELSCSCTIEAELDNVHMTRAALTWHFGAPVETGYASVAY